MEIREDLALESGGESSKVLVSGSAPGKGADLANEDLHNQMHSIQKPMAEKVKAGNRPQQSRRKKETGLVRQILKGRGGDTSREQLTAEELLRRVKAMVEREGVRETGLLISEVDEELAMLKPVPLDLFDITDAMEVELLFGDERSMQSDDIPWRIGL